MRIRTVYVAAVMTICLTPLTGRSESPARQLPGLSVQRGVLVLRGKPFAGIGANYFSLFSRTLEDPTDTSYQKGLRQLSEAGTLCSFHGVRILAG